MTGERKIVIAGGGTGGHVFPALWIGQALRKAWGAELLFIGSEHGVEKKIIPSAGYPLRLLPVQGFHRRWTIQNLWFPWRLFRSLYLCRRWLKEFAPDLVIGTGGYVMGPVLHVARKKGIPYVIQEQNSFPGVTTRMLAADAHMVFLGYEEAKKHLPGHTNTMVVGNPVRPMHRSAPEKQDFEKFSLQPGRPTILVFGGSQGAEKINQAVYEVIGSQTIAGWQWLWQTGERNIEKWHRQLDERRIGDVRVIPFIKEMESAYRIADLVICRAGAITLAELMAMGKAAVLIPLPTAAGNHQWMNARALADKSAAVLLEEGDDLALRLAEIVKTLTHDRERLQRMAERMAAQHRANTIEKIIGKLEEILRAKEGECSKKVRG